MDESTQHDESSETFSAARRAVAKSRGITAAAAAQFLRTQSPEQVKALADSKPAVDPPKAGDAR